MNEDEKAKVEALFNEITSLSPDSQKHLFTLLRAMGAKDIKAVPQVAEDTTTMGAHLYERIKEKAYNYRGIMMPELRELSTTSANLELKEVANWLRYRYRITRAEREGLIELAAETYAREVPAFERTLFANKKAWCAHWCEQIKHIPAAVDRAFPGYRINGILLQLAREVGEGKLRFTKGNIE